MQNLFHARLNVERETRRRIMVAIWAYAYEFENVSLVSDHHFDAECLKVNLSISTTRPDLDKWFRENFQPDTGMWIHKHPELDKVEKTYRRYYARNDVGYRNAGS